MLHSRIDALAERALVGATAQGLVVGVVLPDGERVVRTAGFANRDAQLPVSEETLFEIGSISKSALAIVCMQLEAEGKLDLHAPVTDYLPWFLVQSAFDPITTHHLLSHSSGLPGGHTHRPHAPHEVWELRNVRLIAPPGAVWDYSNVGYDALGLMVEAITGQSFHRFMAERVLEPLGLTSSFAVVTSAIRPQLAVGYTSLYDDRPTLPRYPAVPDTWLETAVGSGSIVMNASDLLAYAEFLRRTWNGEDSDILTSAQLHTMVTPPDLPQSAIEQTYGYGLSWEVDPERPGTITAFGHSGGMVGYTTDLMVDVRREACVVWLANGRIGDWNLTTQVRDAIGMAKDDALPELAPVRDPFAVADAADYAGVWQSRQRAIELLADGETLTLLEVDKRTPLQVSGRGAAFLIDHPDWDRFALQPERAPGDTDESPGPVTRLHHGGETFTRDAAPEPVPYPAEWDRFAGFYRSYNPWGSPIRIAVRDGKLLLFYSSGLPVPLNPEGDGFRVGEAPQNLDFLTFDAIAGDWAFVLRFETGAEFSRFFTE